MPQSAERKNGEGCEHLTPSAVAAAAKGNIDIVAEPRHQRDVPTPPEVRNVASKIWSTEIL